MSTIEHGAQRRALAGAVALAFTSAMAGSASAGALPEPTVFASSRGVLDIVMIAKPKPLAEFAIGRVTPEGWVYEICAKKAADQTRCPAGSSQDYGGARLALKKGDVLKVRLVNKLPLLPDAVHALEDGAAFLTKNPTNIHTHGLIVSPRTPTLKRPTFGDYVFLSLFNKDNPPDAAASAAHQHGGALNDFVDYEIDIPSNHPSGLYFVHPHVHGIALNQISAGLSSLLTVGSAADYACLNLGCTATVSEANTRHITLKDTQVLGDGTLQTQQDPGFCNQLPASAAEVRQGSCPGVDAYAGGKWFFTMNGAAYASIANTSPTGEVWRLLNSSGSVSYRLQLVNDATGRPIPVQVLSIDGASFDVPATATASQLVRIGGLKLRVVSCPGPAGMLPFGRAPVCASEVEMMPSSRIELWSVYRDADDRPAVAPQGATATFKSLGYTSGATADDGDNWPAVDMAKVSFAPSGRTAPPPFVIVRSGIAAGFASGGIFQAQVDNLSNSPMVADAKACKPLPAGWRRRIYFGTPASNADGFGLGIQLIDNNGNPVGPLQDITAFNGSDTPVCVPLAAGNTPARETWELVNTTLEDHNFHIHQTKFRVIDGAASVNSPLSRAMNPALMHDNVPVKHGTTQGCDGTVAGWLSGTCDSKPVLVEIPFPKVGDFVFHCHILEHEDGGMMRKIQVVTAR